MEQYPIDALLPQITSAVLKNPSVVLHAPPGAGKTTRVPIALLDVIPPAQGRIVMLEPRRIAAVSAARWMARSLNEQAGETVGYAIRFDAKRSERTRIEVVTEGILTRRIQSDPGLAGTAMVIFDEFHERSIHADLALALCLDVRKHLREDLRVLVMSATLDHGPVAALLGNAPIISSQGRAFPVEERYLEAGTGPLPARIAAAVRTALRETQGDILVFLPGAGEIRAAAREIQTAVDLEAGRVSVHALYGDLPFEEQERAIMPMRDQRKIVLATNIAETSLTIEGVHVVIDSGLTRLLRYDAATGMNRLVTAPISRSSAEQRKGRAGRLGPGMCYRLYSQQDLKGMVASSLPEILLSDLAPLVLDLAVWGVKDPNTLSWLDPPPAAAWDAGVGLLHDLGALDPANAATPAGRAMARLPLHPRLSRLMVRAQELGCVSLGTDLAALLAERDIFRSGSAERISKEPDISDRLEALRKWRLEGDLHPNADPSALRAVDRTAAQLLRLAPGTPSRPTGEPIDPDALARLLLSAFPDRICKRREESGRNFVHVQGRGVQISPDSHLTNSMFIIAVNVDAGEKTSGYVHLAAPVTESVIRDECSARIKTERKIEWDHKEGRIIAAQEERLGELVLSRRPFTPDDSEAAKILCGVIRRTPGLLVFSPAARQLQARVRLLRRAFPEETWPDLSDEHLLARPEEWLEAWLTKVRSAHTLAALDLVPLLKARLSWDQQRTLDERAPLSISVPSGSRVTIDYTTGEQPVLAVKLQEMFGLGDTPAIAKGRVAVLLHLLSPARRPVQITQDLRGFWNGAYQDVKKDLKGRYPRHPWPDDPWNAVPTRRTKPRT